MTSGHTGLRDRKREETRSRLESAAVTLVLRDGLDHATVDSISSMADVSPRTFFNYFDTKEDAILGIRDVELTPDFIAQHIARTDGVDVVESTITLLLTIISPSIEGKVLHDQRHEILRRHPQLFGRHVAQMTRMIDQIVDAVTLVLEHDSPGLDFDRSEAEVLLGLCAAAVRTTVKSWVDDDDSAPVESLQPRATRLVRAVAQRIR